MIGVLKDVEEAMHQRLYDGSKTRPESGAGPVKSKLHKSIPKKGSHGRRRTKQGNAPKQGYPAIDSLPRRDEVTPQRRASFCTGDVFSSNGVLKDVEEVMHLRTYNGVKSRSLSGAGLLDTKQHKLIPNKGFYGMKHTKQGGAPKSEYPALDSLPRMDRAAPQRRASISTSDVFLSGSARDSDHSVSTSGSRGSSITYWWHRVESSGNLTDLSALMDEGDGYCSSISARRCARMTLGLVAGVALAVMLVYMAREGVSKSMKSFAQGPEDHHLRYRQLPQGGRSMVVGMNPDAVTVGAQGFPEYHYEDGDSLVHVRKTEAVHMPSLTKLINFVQENKPFEWASPAPKKDKQEDKVKLDSQTLKERNRREHLEGGRWKE